MDPLYTSSVFFGTAAAPSSPFTEDLSAIPAGSTRTLIVAFMLTNAGLATGNPAGLVVTFGGVPMTVVGEEAPETMTVCVAYIALDDGTTFASSTLSIGVGTSGADPVDVTGQAFVFENVQTADAISAVAAASGSTTVEVDITPAALGDLVFSFGVRSGVNFDSDWNLVTTDLAEYTLVNPTVIGAFQADDGDGRGARSAFSAGVSGAQALTWSGTTAGHRLALAIAFTACDTSFNCECETDPDAKTLAELRAETLKLTGYAMQASNPPPGVAEQYNAYLRAAQEFLYTEYKALETERFFSWQMTPGIRYYGLRDNRNCCTVELNRYRITGAWLQDLNNVWWPLIAGIDPTFYTLNQKFGWPAFYEVRQCIEVFPAPFAAYTLWIKGHFDLLPFTDDTDVTTISAEPVKNYAVFLAKAAKGAADAKVYEGMARNQVGRLIAGAHTSRRYIPGTSEIPVPTPPVMVHFDA